MNTPECPHCLNTGLVVRDLGAYHGLAPCACIDSRTLTSPQGEDAIWLEEVEAIMKGRRESVTLVDNLA